MKHTSFYFLYLGNTIWKITTADFGGGDVESYCLNFIENRYRYLRKLQQKHQGLVIRFNQEIAEIW